MATQNDTALVVRPTISPILSVEEAVSRRDTMIRYVQATLQEGVDYGTIPGATRPALYKAGAEKFASLFGLTPTFEIVQAETDWIGAAHSGEPFFYYHYRCRLWHNGIQVGEGLGSCNSWESKYRYRSAELACPTCGATGTIIKGRAEYGGGWLCFAKKGGCGAKWPAGAPEIEEQPRGQVRHPNPADLVNTVDKMAQKRALVAAVLVATNASEFFSQDIEDFYSAAASYLPSDPDGIIEHEQEPAVPAPAADPKPAQRRQEPAVEPSPATEPRGAAEPAPAPPEQPENGSTTQALQTRLRALRDAERSVGQEPPEFKYKASDGPDPLVKEINASRKRLYALAKKRVEVTAPLGQLTDDALFLVLGLTLS